MNQRNTAAIRLGLIIGSAVTLAVGLIMRLDSIATIAGVIYVVEGAFGTVVLYCVAKQYKAGTLKFEDDDPPTEGIRSFIDGAVTITGLILLVISKDGDRPGLSTAAMLIWFSAIAFYLMAGWIVRGVAGIAVYMDRFDGWKPGMGPPRRRR